MNTKIASQEKLNQLDLLRCDNSSNPTIYIESLASYNAGTRWGIWIDATQDSANIQEAIDLLLECCPYGGEDWSIHGSSNFNGLTLNSHDLDSISEIANAIDEYGDSFLAYLASVGFLSNASVDDYQDRYYSCYDDQEDFVIEYLESCCVIYNKLPDIIKNSIDFDQIYDQLSYDFYEQEYKGTTYLFFH